MYTLIKIFLKVALYVLLFAVGVVVIFGVLFNWPVQSKNEDMKMGISFVDHHARSLNLDWKETYIAILDEFDVERIRLGAYWNEIEQEPGKFDFSNLDYQIEEAQKRDVEVILAFGIKAPRWPECFIPEFYEDDKQLREEKLLEYEENLIKRYKDYDAIKHWQVENEPFLPFFGECPPGAVDGELVDREIAQVKEIDPTREVIITDSGELSIWHEAAKRADIFGTTLYRTIYKEPYGYVTYPVGPNFFRMKALLVRITAGQSDIIISELQAEPWGPGWIEHMSLEEQYKSMNPEIFKETVEYAKKTKFDSAYLWGAEWWYWLKTKKGEDGMWEAAKEVFTERNETEANKNELKSCAGDYQCPEDYTCYHSQYSGMGPEGVVTGSEEGDLLCHKKCESDSDCEQGACRDVEITGGDVIVMEKMCISE